MPYGFTGSILRVDLTADRIEVARMEDSFYRTYMGGGALGATFLLRECAPDLDPFDPGNLLVIAPGVTTGAAVSGVSRCSVTSLSPATGMVGDSQAGGSLGPAIKRAGFDAIVISGRAAAPSVLYVHDGGAEIQPGDHLAGKTTTEVLEMLHAVHGEGKVAILQCGPAGEARVRFACLVADGHNVAGRTGMGAVFGSKNLRAVVVRTRGDLHFADPEGLRDLARRAAGRVDDAGFPSILRQHGTPGVVAIQAQGGNFASHNHTRGTIDGYERLDGGSYQPDLGAGETTCYGCVVRCRKKVRATRPYPLTDRLGGPEFETLGLLGSNLDITDAAAVARASQLCGELGLDTITTGGLAGYLFECFERGLLSPDRVGRSLGFGRPDDLLWLIERIGRREGVGDVLADGFHACLEAFGPQTAPFAVQVKNQGLPVHMPQVKPSQALMYAVCPIGPDHQSCEHDWLLASGGEDALGLGILGKGDAASTGLAKVRMTVYSQYFYSLLDTLCLCMFCWGPGNLFTYPEIEELVRVTTGWHCTLWELMKVGERRVNLMRQINARRGFGSACDQLPPRVFEPLPDGPSQGRHVDPGDFDAMRTTYYELMGWDPATGNPTPGKLRELGLEWAI